MKKIVLSIMMIIIFFISNISYADIATKAKVNVTATRIRESASTDSKIVTNVYEEDEVEVLEKNGEWYKVKSGDSVGYAKAEFFTITQEGETPTTPESTSTPVENVVNETSNSTTENVANNAVQNTVPETAVDNTQNQPVENVNTPTEINVNDNITLNNTIKIRELPSICATEKKEIAQGENIRIETLMGKWFKVSTQDGYGWISKEKLVALQTQNVPAPEQTPQQNPEPTPEPEQPKQEQTEEPKQENTVDEQSSVSENTNTTVSEQTTTENTNTETNNTTSRTGVVNVETARIREKASTTAEVVDTLDEDAVVNIIGEEGNFYKIKKGDLTGYISKDLVKEKGVTSRGTTEEREIANSKSGNDVVEFAKQYLGYPYVLGASSPEKGFDCSGFTRYVFGHFGYSLGSVAASQTSVGDVVERENLQTGDLILFYNDAKTKIGHCAIYIGDGNFIHSANPQRGVVIDNLNTNSYYNTRFVTARRIV